MGFFMVDRMLVGKVFDDFIDNFEGTKKNINVLLVFFFVEVILKEFS